jgi:hypothetical protein
MQELRLVAVSEDGSYAVLVVPGRSGRFALPIDERLRTVARGQFSRLAQYEIEVESPLRPKEIQDRIRAGETAEEIADTAGLPVERIRRFEGPVLAEREFRAGEAQRATVRGPGESGHGQRLGEIVTDRLAEIGATAEDQEWDSRKRQDGNWQIQLAYTIAGRMHVAEWVYDPKGRYVTPEDDEAIRLCLDQEYWPQPKQNGPAVVTATVTPIGARAAAAALHPSDHRADPDRPGGAREGAREIVHPSRAAAPAASPTTAPAAKVMPAASPAAPAVSAAPPAASAGRPSAAPVSGRPERPGSREPADRQAGQRRGSGLAQEPADEDTTVQPAPEPVPAPEADRPPEPDTAPTARPARRASGGRSRRSSVPSWDEIMFGNSRQPE